MWLCLEPPLLKFLELTTVRDLTTGAFGMPLLASILLDINAKDTCLKSQVLTIKSSSTQSSIFLTVLLALDRYLHMNPDIRAHRSTIMKIFSKPIIYFILAAMFIITGSLLATIAFLLYTTFTVSTSTSVTNAFVFLLICIACLYTKGYLRILTKAHSRSWILLRRKQAEWRKKRIDNV